MDSFTTARRVRLAPIALVALVSCAQPAAPKVPPPEPAASAAPSATEVAPAAPTATASAVSVEPPAPPALPKVELVVVEPSPAEGPPPALAISAPGKNQVIASNKAAAFTLKLSAGGFKVGDRGKHLCVVLDRRPCRRVDDLSKPIRLGDLDASIDDGQHVISVFARLGSGEVVRPLGKRAAFASSSFFVGKKGPLAHKDGAPMILFSPPPEGAMSGEGLLIDYYVANTEIADGKVVVHASVGGPGIDGGVGLSLSSWKPLRVKNARPGDYIARVSLSGYQAELGASGSHTEVRYAAQPLKGAFAEVTREFRVPAAR